MDRAAKAIKRGSIRLKPYSELNLIVSDLNNMRSYGKSALNAHNIFIEDLIKWIQSDSTEGVRNNLALLSEISILWNEIHTEYFDSLKRFKQQFESILESEQIIDKARANVQTCESTEFKIGKELDKIVLRGTGEVIKVTEKLREAKRATENARIEVAQKETENRIVKNIRLKEGLKKLTEAQMKLSNKCNVILNAQKVIANEYPDEVDSNPYPDFPSENKVQHAITKAKTILENSKTFNNNDTVAQAQEYEPPPPYSPQYPTLSNSLPSYSTIPSTSNNSATMNNLNQGVSDNRQCPMNKPPYNIEPKIYVCNKCSSQIVSDHCYVTVCDLPTVPIPIDHQLIANFRNSQI